MLKTVVKASWIPEYTMRRFFVCGSYRGNFACHTCWTKYRRDVVSPGPPGFYMLHQLDLLVQHVDVCACRHSLWFSTPVVHSATTPPHASTDKNVTRTWFLVCTVSKKVMLFKQFYALYTYLPRRHRHRVDVKQACLCDSQVFLNKRRFMRVHISHKLQNNR